MMDCCGCGFHCVVDCHLDGPRDQNMDHSEWTILAAVYNVAMRPIMDYITMTMMMRWTNAFDSSKYRYAFYVRMTMKRTRQHHSQHQHHPRTIGGPIAIAGPRTLGTSSLPIGDSNHCKNRDHFHNCSKGR